MKINPFLLPPPALSPRRGIRIRTPSPGALAGGGQGEGLRSLATRSPLVIFSLPSYNDKYRLIPMPKIITCSLRLDQPASGDYYCDPERRLDYCSDHWDKQGIQTGINFKQIEEIIEVNPASH
jgi:hypothetical protein